MMEPGQTKKLMKIMNVMKIMRILVRIIKLEKLMELVKMKTSTILEQDRQNQPFYLLKWIWAKLNSIRRESGLNASK